MLESRTYYSFNMLGDAAKGDKGNQKITSGTQGHNYDSYKYGFTVDSGYKEDGSKITATVNGYDSRCQKDRRIIKRGKDMMEREQ